MRMESLVRQAAARALRLQRAPAILGLDVRLLERIAAVASRELHGRGATDCAPPSHQRSRRIRGSERHSGQGSGGAPFRSAWVGLLQRRLGHGEGRRKADTIHPVDAHQLEQRGVRSPTLFRSRRTLTRAVPNRPLTGALRAKSLRQPARALVQVELRLIVGSSVSCSAARACACSTFRYCHDSGACRCGRTVTSASAAVRFARSTRGCMRTAPL